MQHSLSNAVKMGFFLAVSSYIFRVSEVGPPFSSLTVTPGCTDINTAGCLSVRLKMSLNERSLAVAYMLYVQSMPEPVVSHSVKELIICTYD